MTNLNELINKYADEIERIIENDTAGDYTWLGLLVTFATEAGLIPGPTTPKPVEQTKYVVQCRWPSEGILGWDDVLTFDDSANADKEAQRRAQSYPDLEYRVVPRSSSW